MVFILVNTLPPTDINSVKRSLAALLLLSALMLFAEPAPWPVFSFRYEVAEGAEEDEDQGELIPTYLRNTVAFKAAEEFSNFFSGSLLFRYSQKIFFASEGDYFYYAVDPAADFAFGDALQLGLSATAKRVYFAQADSKGDAKDYLAFGGKVETAWKVSRSLRLEAYLRGDLSLYENEEKARQAYTLGMGASSRLGAFSLGAPRYRGIGRFPLGLGSTVVESFYHVGSLNLSWDLNR